LVIAYSSAARQQLRNTERSYPDAFVRRFGRTALLEATEFGALLALRLRERHGGDVQVALTEPFNEFDHVTDAVREAVAAYADRDHAATSYAKFAAGTGHPDPEALRDREL
jgi:S-adenosylhomocysteine hydrolase